MRRTIAAIYLVSAKDPMYGKMIDSHMKCMARPQSGRSNSTVCRVIWNTELLSLGSQAVHKQQRERQIRQHGRFVLHYRSDGAPGEGIYSRLYNSGWIHTSVRQPDCKIQDYHELSVRFSRQFRNIHERLQGEFSTWCWNRDSFCW